MPRPPILPALDLAAIHQAARTYRQWLDIAEKPANAEVMEQRRSATVLEPLHEALLAALPRPVHVLVIAEDWCGDVHRHVPILERLADAAPNLHTRYLLRGEHRDLFARFLTNGGEAIPKLIFLNHECKECGNWGPMPAGCRRLIARGKAAGDIAAARRQVSTRYDADPNGNETIAEILDLLEIATCTQP